MLNLFLFVLALFLVCFLLGSIPWGVVISKLFFKKDIRSEGSGNIGATNALRTLGKKGGAAVFVLDFAKGLLSGAVALLFVGFALRGGTTALVGAHFSGAENLALLIAGSSEVNSECTLYIRHFLCAIAFLSCIWGHIFSPWLGFKGGKGIAVAVGCEFIVLGVVPTLIEIALFAVIVVVTRYVSLGSLAAAVLAPFLALWVMWGHWPAVAIVTLAALTVIWAHRGNISRLAQGTERKIGKK